MPRPNAASSSLVDRRPFRPDIEGLRALAVMLVVAFHAGIPRHHGRLCRRRHLLRDLGLPDHGPAGRGARAQRHASRCARSTRGERGACYRWRRSCSSRSRSACSSSRPRCSARHVRFDALSAVFYYSNWQFALESVNYLTLGGAAEPRAALLVAQRRGAVLPRVAGAADPRSVALAWARAGCARAAVPPSIAVVGGASLAYSVVETAAQPAIAYFETRRACGGSPPAPALALARAAAHVRPRFARSGWLGRASRPSSLQCSRTGRSTEFPGTAALLPVAGAGLVIAAGLAAPARGVGALLSLGPLRYVGKISYAWYLWHWPCLVFARTARWAPADGRIGWVATGAAVAISLVLAIVTHAVVEAPARRARWFAVDRRRVLLLASSATALPWSPSASAAGRSCFPALRIRATRRHPCGGDAARSAGVDAVRVRCTAVTSATAPRPAVRCVFGAASAGGPSCSSATRMRRNGFPRSSGSPLHERFRLIAWTKSGCPLAPGVPHLPAGDRPRLHRVQRLADARPAASACDAAPGDDHRRAHVDLSAAGADGGRGRRDRRGARPRDLGRGRRGGGLEPCGAIATRVILLRDTPHAPFDVPGCISWDPRRSSRCNSRAARASDAAEYAAERAAGRPAHRLCGSDAGGLPAHDVPAVAGGVITYRDDNHLTAAYAASRWRQFAQALSSATTRRPI